MRRSLTGLDVNKSILLGATLWDWRAELASAGQGDVNELSAFGAWVTSDRFPMAWWLPRLVFAITAPSFSIEWRLGEYIAQAAPQYPDEALLVIQRLLAARPEPYQRYGLMGQVPAVVAAALDHGTLGTREAAENLLDELGRSGHLNIAEMVLRRRRPEGSA